jgi:hypothetical protein
MSPAAPNVRDRRKYVGKLTGWDVASNSLSGTNQLRASYLTLDLDGARNCLDGHP